MNLTCTSFITISSAYVASADVAKMRPCYSGVIFENQVKKNEGQNLSKHYENKKQ